ncbi:MAG: MBL fold metallo-hydrolase [Planctomycetota bacterium]
MRIEFLGAVRNVTGSRHLIHVNNSKVLLECGMFHGHRLDAYERNKSFPFNPAEISAVVLSHAHIDHSGNLPILHAQGFNNNIYCTSATRDLCGIMLRDSAHIQERDVEYLRKKAAKTGEQPLDPLYTMTDAEKVMRHFVGLGYHRRFWVAEGVEGMFYDAGHILGAAVVILEIQEKGRKTRLAFTGDLGHPNMPILRDPEIVKAIDVLITESTYGNRVHDPAERMEEKFADVVRRTVSRGGKIIVPAFSVGRTQNVVYLLHKLALAERIPHIPVFVDSPLSVNATEVFKMHAECYDEEARRLLTRSGPNGLFGNGMGFEQIQYIRDVEESKKLNDRKAPCVIISSSGMCEIGRILHHLKNNIEDERNTVMIVGFMAENTLGKRLVDHERRVKILGEKFDVNAEVVVFNALSAHADKNDLLDYFKAVDGHIRKAFIVHGAEDQSLALADHMRGLAIEEVIVPELGEGFEV